MGKTLLSLIAALAVPVFGISVNAIYGSAYTGPGAPATLYSINSTTGAAAPIGSIGFNQVGAMAFSSVGTLYGTGKSGSNWYLITINTTSGAGTAVGQTGGIGPFQDIAFRSDGVLFGYAGGVVYTLNTTTGAATLIGDTGGFPDGNGLAFSPGGTLYSANQTDLRSINQTTGAETVVEPLSYSSSFGTNENRAAGMKYGTDGTLWAAVIDGGGDGSTGSGSLGIINTATGVVSFVGTSVQGLDGLAVIGDPSTPVAPPTTPAPPSLLLLLVGVLAILTFTAWRTRKNPRQQAF